MELSHKSFLDSRGSTTSFDLSEKDYKQVLVSYNKHIHTFRGFHYQEKPQNKYVKVVNGLILDILYNLKTGELETYNLGTGNSLYVGDNYAHGYLTLQPNTTLVYLMDEHFDKESYKIIPFQNIPGASNILENKVINLKNLVISENDKL